MSYFITPRRNAKYEPKRAKPREEAPPTCAEIDYNKDWVPEKSDQYVGYKPWFVIDAAEKFLDDVSDTAAHYLLGRQFSTVDNKYDTACPVIITNVQKVRVPGREFYTRMYAFSFKGLKAATYEKNFWWMISHQPDMLMRREVWIRMRHNFRNRRMIREYLHTYPGPIHPHVEQKPIDITDQVGLEADERHKNKYGEDTVAGQIKGWDYENRDNEPNLYK